MADNVKISPTNLVYELIIQKNFFLSKEDSWAISNLTGYKRICSYFCSFRRNLSGKILDGLPCSRIGVPEFKGRPFRNPLIECGEYSDDGGQWRKIYFCHLSFIGFSRRRSIRQFCIEFQRSNWHVICLLSHSEKDKRKTSLLIYHEDGPDESKGFDVRTIL